MRELNLANILQCLSIAERMDTCDTYINPVLKVRFRDLTVTDAPNVHRICDFYIFTFVLYVEA